ncbi:hypothetical protein RhiirA5_413442 [Rhizophagus irregularis]|uniref:RNase H type-1 domain-containing protein n=1 Tax=Rhizophagus irregularis TaxID=588596 RepID=A0A2N0P5E9_9GLOM|nr:hypothetical protein RhiirA5_425821 [Rhizophagus irregularis]PKC11164.1 hypothetical protein RhiirA5_413442 [Rhizophagus irregularis]
MYVTQLIDENNRLKTWRQITGEAGRSSKGRVPLWFNEIEKKMIKNDSREVHSGYELIREVYNRYNNNIVYENYWEKLERDFIGRDLEELLEFDNRFNIMKMSFEDCRGLLELKNAFMQLGDFKQENISLYTDGSKKNGDNGIGWVVMDENNIIGKGSFKIEGKYEVWELELIAIIIGLLIIMKGAKVNIFTDSQVVLDLWYKLIVDNRIWSTRRIWNIKSIGLWRWLKWLMIKLEWDLVFYKVKGHSGILGNELADGLSKIALMTKEDRNLIIIKLNQEIDWEYNLYWKKELIKEAPREFYKLYNQWSYKAEFLSLDVCRYYRFNNSIEKIDWVRSIRIIMKAFNEENTDKNNSDNAYNIKNFLEILPVATLLNKRNPELYQSGRCIRCNYTIETWTHIWICSQADTSIIQIINTAFESLKAKLDEKDFRIYYNYHARLLHILNEKSKVVFNGRIFHEAIKGIVNKRLFLEIEDKIFKDAIASFVEDIHDMARKFMWSERCKSFNEWELRQGITKQMKKASKLHQSSLPSLGHDEKKRKLFIYDALQRWTGYYINNDIVAKSIWYEIGIEDLWKYYTLVTFRSSNYASNFSILD